MTSVYSHFSSSVPILIAIAGPTATGKSGLALALAQRLSTVILSADSRQVYRKFDIGTAKPSPSEQAQVPHYLIDICDPTETLTLAQYQGQAQSLIAKFHHQLDGSGQPVNPQFPPIPLLVGGTGLYVRSIVQGLKIPRVPPQPALRSQLVDLGQPQCYGLLQQVDPSTAHRLHPNDQTRTLRALEVFYVSGQPMSAQQGQDPPPYPILQVGLDCQHTEVLRQRIEKRTGQMIESGLVAEVSALCQKYGSELPLLDTLGYREIKQHLAGEVSLAKAQQLTVLSTRQFAKRQRTWFRADPGIKWFDADAVDLVDQVWQLILSFFEEVRIVNNP